MVDSQHRSMPTLQAKASEFRSFRELELARTASRSHSVRAGLKE